MARPSTANLLGHRRFPGSQERHGCDSEVGADSECSVAGGCQLSALIATEQQVLSQREI